MGATPFIFNAKNITSIIAALCKWGFKADVFIALRYHFTILQTLAYKIFSQFIFQSQIIKV